MTLEERLKAIARVRLLRDANGIRNAAITQLSVQGGGRLYRRRNITHRASAPLQPPAVDTGRLRQSINIDASNLGDLKIRVGTNVRYAKILEFGSRRMQPRPFMRPALEQWRHSTPATP